MQGQERYSYEVLADQQKKRIEEVLVSLNANYCDVYDQKKAVEGLLSLITEGCSDIINGVEGIQLSFSAPPTPVRDNSLKKLIIDC